MISVLTVEHAELGLDRADRLTGEDIAVAGFCGAPGEQVYNRKKTLEAYPTNEKLCNKTSEI